MRLKIERGLPALIAIVFSVIGLYWRYVTLARRDFWEDELYQINDLVGPFRPLWDRRALGELTSFQGDYLLTWPFAYFFGPNKWAMAIPHIAATVLGCYVLYRICQRYFQTWVGYFVAFGIVCFNRNLILHSFELRPYAVLPTLALICFYLTERLFQNTLSDLKRWFIGMFFVFTAFFHAYGILIVSVCLMYFILCARAQRSWGDIWRDQGRFLIGFYVLAAGIFLYYATGNPQFGTHYCRPRNIYTFQFIPNPLDNFLGFAKGIVGNLIGDRRWYPALLGLTALILPHPARWRQWGFLLVLVILPLQLICLSDMTQEYWFIQRQFVWMIPWFAFFLGWTWDNIFQKSKKVINPSG